VPARLIARENGEATVVFASGEFGVSPGQACVFYDRADDDARVLGGGFISAVEPAKYPVSTMAPTPRAATARGAPR
jgi:tRNA-specific 2-thiouridylase